MQNAVVLDEPLTRLADVLSEQGFRLFSTGIGLLGLGILASPASFALPAAASGATLLALASLGLGVSAFRLARRRLTARDVASLADDDPAPCFLVSAEGEPRYRNAAALRRFPAAPDATLSRTFCELFANPSAVISRLQERAMAVGGAREDVVTRRGHLRLTVTCLRDAGFFWRLEEVQDARAAVRGAEGMSLPMLVAARTGTVLFMNEAMRRVLGRRVRHLDRVMTDLPPRQGGIHQVLTADGPRPFRIAAMEGPGGRSEVFLLPVAPGEAATDKPCARVEDLPVAILHLGADGKVAAANRLARNLLGSHGDDIVGSPLSEHFEGLGRPVRDWVEDAAKGRGLGRPEVLRLRSDTTESFLQVTLGRATGEDGVRLVAVLNDATELKTLEAQFVQSQKMQAIGQLAGGVAHDFNNLLTAISGHCDLMMLRHDQGDPDYGDLVQIHQNANRAASLVGQLLAFSRKQTLQPEVIDLRDALSDLTHLLNRLVGERVALTLRHEPGLPPVRADRRQLEQVIMNLVVNARDAMPDGGEIRIETMERILGDELRRDRAKVPPGHYVVIKVEDQGTGIPADKLTKIFEPFYTTKRVGEGTGLGLSTAYGIVKQSGGFIFVDSALGAGTVFTLYFPAHDAEEPAADDDFAADPQMSARVIPPAAARALSAPEETSSPSLSRAARRGSLRSATAFGGAHEAGVGAVAPVRGTGAAEAGETGRDADAAAPDVAPPSSNEPGNDGVAPESLGGAPGTSPRDSGPDAAAARTDRGEGVILLVEDEAPVRAFASRALRMRGYTVIEAESGEEALETLEDPLLEVDVFVTDVIMPGMDGPTWVRRALEMRPGVKVVFVSGYAEDSFGDERTRIPDSVFLPKPFSLGELTATVQDQLL